MLVCLPLALIYPHLHKAILFFIGFTLVANVPLWMCPLTYIENKLRRDGGYEGTFFRKYLEKILGIRVTDGKLKFYQLIYFVTTILISIFYRMHTAF